MSVMDFLHAHRSFGEVVAQPDRSRISVAASACQGEGRVSVHAKAVSGHHIGGLLSVDATLILIAQLQEAVEYAQSVAAEQRVASIPELERKLADARAAGDSS